MSQKQRLSISNEQRLFMLREFTTIRRGLEKELALEGISNEARVAVVNEFDLVSDMIRKLERHSSFTPGVHY